MFYTLSSATRQGDRICLYPTLNAARAHTPDGQAVHAVAVDIDPYRRCLISQWKQVPGLEPGWTTLFEPDADGAISTRGPIPEQLFVN